ncbi:nucleoside hydrolase [Fusibacter ferrireducens]|uniref:Nucleoside hydrolase n=1 Tax=Fusibacter ferrireducens TaxID=2785058 RepID=A0ABR9ZNL3_9FIRM|nr:nucleoside hydrolase [Fusibacter ferrireducens]MBF4691576.1 nucleoside hydrolase [Fusibacter ferrireducens]
MRKFIIDTDTASDDAVALIMALREKEVKVEAITVVAGNVPIDVAVKNALISVEMANTYKPPVFKGIAKPILRELVDSEYVHGSDGMGEMNLPDPTIQIEQEHAVDAMIRMIEAHDDQELELITLGPLTNLAVAYVKAPEILKKLKRVTIMGGAGLKSGNITPVAEFNIYVDPEAAQIVAASGLPLYFVGWDASMGESFLNLDDLEFLNNSGSETAKFCVRCNKSLQTFNLERLNHQGFDLPDPATVAAAFYPEIVENYDAYCYVEYKSEMNSGQLVIDYLSILNEPPNATFCGVLNGAAFKQKLFELIID